MNSSLKKTIIWLTLFSIAMGFLETSVVVYLRELYYPDGFGFPLMPIGKDLAITEIWREAATIIMLLGVAVLAGKNANQRFAFFLFCFAVWDIFYYVFLYVLIDWPQSLMTWDILFLIPLPWVGPVLSPLIITLQMIALAGLILYFDQKGNKAGINRLEWLILIAGSLIVIISWILDYYQFVTANSPDASIWSFASKEALFEATQSYVPQSFNWLLFACGVLVISVAMVFYYLRNRKQLSTNHADK